MPTQIELMAEANRRGILPEDKKPLFDEAVKRGLIDHSGKLNLQAPEGEMSFKQDFPVSRAVSRFTRPLLEIGGLIGGGMAGAPAAPQTLGISSVAGAGLGYAGGAAIADELDAFLKLTERKDWEQQYAKGAGDIAKGAMYEMGGQLVGSALTYGGKKLGDFFGWLKSKFPSMSDAAILSRAREELEVIRAVTPEMEKTAKDTTGMLKRLEVKTPPTFAQQTGSRKAAAYEQAVSAQDKEAQAVLFAQDAQIRKEGLGTVNEMLETGKTVDDLVSGVVKQKQAMENQALQAAKSADKLTTPLFTVPTPQATGKAIEETLQATKTTQKGLMEAEYAQIPEGIQLSGAPLKTSISGIAKDYKLKGGGPDTLPTPIIKQINKGLKDGEGNVTFDQLRDWRSQIGQEIRDNITGANPNLKLVRRLKQLGNGVDDSMDQMYKLGKGQETVIAQYRRASDLYREYVKTFRKGTVGEVLQPGDLSTGGKVAYSEIPNRFFRTGKMDVADDLINAVGKANAGKLIDDFASFDLVIKAGKDGLMKTKIASDWLFKNKTVLDKYGLYDKYAKIVKSNKISDDIAGELTAYTKSIATRVLEADVDKVILKVFSGEGAINSAATMRDLLSLSGVRGNPAAIRGLKSSFKDFLLKQAEVDKVDALQNPVHSIHTFGKLINKYLPAMRVLYKGEMDKIKALQDYHSLLRMLSRNKNVTYAGGSPTVEKATGTAQKVRSEILERFAQLGAIRLGKGWIYSASRNLARSLLSAPEKFTREQIDILLKEAIFNPDVAKTVMEATKPLTGKMSLKVFYKRPEAGGKAVDYLPPAMRLNKKTGEIEELGRSMKYHLLTMGAYSTAEMLEED